MGSQAQDRLAVVGEFTSPQIDAVERSLSSTRFRLDHATTRLEQVRGTVAEGKAKAEADRIAKALGDEAFVDAVTTYDKAVSNHAAALKSFGRCRSRHGRGMTETAMARQNEMFHAKHLADEAWGTLEPLAKTHGITERRDHTIHGVHAWLRRRLSSLRASCDEARLPEEIEKAEREVETLGAKLRTMEAHRVPEKTLRMFGLYLDAKTQKILTRMVLEDYKPQTKTLAKNPAFKTLDELGFLELTEHYVRVAGIGVDVARWIRDNVAGTAAATSGRLAFTINEVRGAFTRSERLALVDNGTELLDWLRRHGQDDQSLAEVGIPGASYRVYRTFTAVQRFLYAVGMKKTKKTKARLLRRKLPEYTPGRFVEG